MLKFASIPKENQKSQAGFFKVFVLPVFYQAELKWERCGGEFAKEMSGCRKLCHTTEDNKCLFHSSNLHSLLFLKDANCSPRLVGCMILLEDTGFHYLKCL